MVRSASILVVSGTYPPDIGGSEASLGTACRELARRGHRVVVLADDRRPARDIVEGVQVWGVKPAEVWETMDALHREERFHLVLTQLIFSREALRWASALGIPSIYFVRNAEMRVDLSVHAPHTPARLVASSRFLARRIQAQWGRQSDVVYPLVDQRIVRPDTRRGNDVLMINPIVLKGGAVLRSLALRHPDRPFLAVQCWTGLRRRDPGEGWDPRQWSLMAKAHDDPTVHPPEEPDFSDLPNVKISPPTPDMRAIYGRARVLLFPAQWEEAFGRAVLEALLCGIPVLATPVGGLLETGLCRGGIVLPRGADAELWSRALLELDNPAVYAAASEGAREDSAWYNLDEQVDKLEAVLAECLRRKGQPW